MSQPPADSAEAIPSTNWPAGPKAPDEGWPAGPKPPGKGWSRKKFFFILLFVLAFHVALIVLFGSKKQIVPRAVANVPHLALASSANEMIALSDPTLFARPNARDIVSAYWRREPEVVQPNFNWPAPSGYLQPAAENFGAVFLDFMRRSQPPEFVIDLKPEPTPTQPDVQYNAVPPFTIMRISGDLSARKLLTEADLPSLARNDVIGATRIQALVAPNGNVASAVVLKSGDLNNADNAADQVALQIVRDLRFIPAPGLTFGEITFTWHTVPTNSVPAVNKP
jgi:hypothetical protein